MTKQSKGKPGKAVSLWTDELMTPEQFEELKAVLMKRIKDDNLRICVSIPADSDLATELASYMGKED